ncbi:MAG: hypothetical protein DMF62_00565 [Acidobacteria bacterium]|nr:MAG: hypothetical protein DMF62_00565 [Acidobacteriota bacterium]
MKKKLFVIASALMLLGFVSLNVFSQKKPVVIEFERLSSYVNDWDKRRDGEHLIVNVAATIDSIQYQKSNNLYSFQAGENTDVGSTFFSSPILGKSLRQRLSQHSEASVYVYCTLVQFVGEQDVFRAPFVTKVEGFDGHGRLVWTVVGPPPAKLKMSQ